MALAHQKRVLENGVRVVGVPMSARKSLALGIWIGVGGRYEATSQKGISHFLEHLLFKGSRKYSCRKIKESVEGIGGSLNGFTSEEFTCYLVKIPALYLEQAFDILSDMVLNPLLIQEDIDKERTVILEEIKMYRDLPQSYVHELLDELFWPGQPLGNAVIGSEASVAAMNREDIAGFKQAYYVPANIVVSACGNFKFEKLAKLVNQRFGKSKPGVKSCFEPAFKVSGPHLNAFDKPTEQTHLALGVHAFRRDDPRRYALALLNVILGGNMSSRLFNEVREKRGLAYEIGTQVKRLHDAGSFVVHAGIDNSKVNQALSVILSELTKVSKQLVGEDELKRAKEFYLGQFMLGLEDTLDQMLWIGETTTSLNRVFSFQEVIKAVSAVSRKEIREVAATMFCDDNLRAALIGPVNNIADSLKDTLRFS